MSRDIWVADYLDYPESGGGVCGFYESEEAAVQDIKNKYGPPCRVKWSQARDDNGALILTGEFEAVPHYSTEHTGEWEIRQEQVVA